MRMVVALTLNNLPHTSITDNR